jgi:hypothetical protein
MVPPLASRPRAQKTHVRSATSLALAAAVGLSACFFSASAVAESTDSTAGFKPVEPMTLDELPPPSVRGYTVLGGLATTAGWYGLALGASYLWPNTVGAKDLRIPVAGPWIAFAHSGCGPVADCHEVVVVGRALATLLDGVGQLSGLAIVAQGLFLSTRERVQAPKPARTLSLHPLFDAGKNSVSLGVFGVF